jgi:hypothetical protein
MFELHFSETTELEQEDGLFSANGHRIVVWCQLLRRCELLFVACLQKKKQKQKSQFKK